MTPSSRWRWLAVCVAGLILPPWYADGAWGHGAVTEALTRPWLWPLWLAPLLAWRDRPAWLITAGGFGLTWLALESLLIGPRAAAVSLPAGWPTTQGALGWGALVYAIACGGWSARGLARRGLGDGQSFVTGSLFLLGSALTVFVLYPILCVLVSAVRDEAGQLAFGMFARKITAPDIWGLGCVTGGGACGVAWNSLAIAVLVGVLTTALGLAFALLLTRSSLPLKPVLRGLSILPIVTPPFVIGLALILLFGRSGMVSNFLATHFGIPRGRWIYGAWGITIAQVLAFTPIAFTILTSVLEGISPTLEEASRMLKASRWYVFRTVTWPLLRPGLTNSFLIGFVESLADFANPLMIGGNFNVLSTEIFFAVVGAAHDESRAAILAVILLVFTLVAFAAQGWWQGRARYTTISGKGDSGRHAPLPQALTGLCVFVVLPWMLLTAAVYGIILLGGFARQVGRDNTPTLEFFVTAFGVDKGAGGWFLSGSAWPSFLTTIELALIAMPITAALGVLAAYLLDRVRFAGRDAFEFVTMMSFAIPGTVIGVGYILAFNAGAIQLTGTGMIIVAALVFRNMPVGIRAALASLSQIDRGLDEASLTLRESRAGTLRRVILPLLRPAIAIGMTYGLVRAMTAVSAVIFLVSGGINLATVYIVGRADVGEHGIAIVYSAVLIVFMMSILLVIQVLLGRARLGRRPGTMVVPS